MFVLTRLLKGYSQPLLYSIPDNWEYTNLEGEIITVPFRNKLLPALVTKTYNHLPFKPTFSIRPAKEINPFPRDKNYHSFIRSIADRSIIDPFSLYQRIYQLVQKSPSAGETNDLYEEKYISDTLEQPRPIPTEEQSRVITFMGQALGKDIYTPTLLHGVTGSGKTEVYASLIEQAIAMKKTVILILPEVSLSVQFQRIFKQKLPTVPIFSFHSATLQKEKMLLWQHIIQGRPVLIIGVHLPILLPITNLGLIIVDEEHDPNFQEKKHPKLCSKTAALIRARISKIPILLGSATPSLSSLHQVKQKKLHFFQIKKRFRGHFPKIKLVSLKKRGIKRQSFWITQELENAIQETLAQKKQILIYLNRRGFSFFVTCKQCNFVFKCNSCSVSLTLHQLKKPLLRCHYCNSSRYLPTSCPQCNAPEKMFLKKGIGTQQALLLLQSLFPLARIERADLDTTRKKRLWNETVKKFEDGKIDILVGTQTITKGYHFPNVTLVGVLWGDLNLNFPVYNARETTLQQLVQVAGRAGRQSDSSTVIIQVMNENPLFDYLNEQDYLKFYKDEMEFRNQCHYPPAYHLTTVELRHNNPVVIDLEAQTFADNAKTWSINNKKEVKVLGPVKPIVYRIQKTEIRQIFFKAPSSDDLNALCKELKSKRFKCTISIIPSSL